MAITTVETLRAVSEIANAAGKIPMSYFRKPLELVTKYDESPVTIADRNTEKFIREQIIKIYPNDGILGEELGVTRGKNNVLWIIDPIDGTRSFITGNPLFGMLIGRYVDGESELGLVHMPALGETFIGASGQGAMLNGRPIKVRQIHELERAMIYINEAEKIAAADPARFERLCRIGHTRRMSYDCYPHALVSSGQIDAVVDCGLQPYDFLPLVALVKSAGGIISDWQGQPLTLESDGRIVTAATPALRDAILEVLNP